MTISAGLTLVHSGDTLPVLVARADECLYAAKRAGRDGWRGQVDQEEMQSAFPDV
ncbi:hypothetical protein [Deinococcus sp. JMULE3]|uniref:hypothetical protein n=1 Tax=Deinococcus sp. JMULE3 TaxID=2518341 RepID=UPI001575A984|nr:hypothetical protein [Deinococcus sp. JMULE3]